MRGSGTDREAARTLEGVDQIRRRVINVVGHELRTPMTTLRGLADQLEAATDDESRRALSGALWRNAARVEIPLLLKSGGAGPLAAAQLAAASR